MRMRVSVPRRDVAPLTLLPKRDRATVKAGADRDIDDRERRPLRPGGEPLPEQVRGFFEPRFGFDFSRVRVHHDGEAATAAARLGAQAFTTGADIGFAEGQYAPATETGRSLLAHELTHVVQQGRSGQPPAVQMKRTRWRVFNKEKEARANLEHVRALGLDLPGEVLRKSKEGFTFFYDQLSEDEAEIKRKEVEKAKGPDFTVTIARDERAQSWFVKVEVKCPQAMPAKPGLDKWPDCFGSKKEAESKVDDLKSAGLDAQVHTLDAVHHGVYFAPLTKAQAEAKATEIAKGRKGFAEGMFKVSGKEDKGRRSFVPLVEAVCPPGYHEKGRFRLTTYHIAMEDDFAQKDLVDVPGLPGRKLPKDFLYRNSKNSKDCHDGAAPCGVRLEGTGFTRSGEFIHPAGDKFELGPQCALIPGQKCAREGITVAVDVNVIPLGTDLLIEDEGAKVAEDIGKSIRKDHIDIYRGQIRWDKAAGMNARNKLVCAKDQAKSGKP